MNKEALVKRYPFLACRACPLFQKAEYLQDFDGAPVYTMTCDDHTFNIVVDQTVAEGGYVADNLIDGCLLRFFTDILKSKGET